MYNTMFRRIVVFYFCIVSLILSYKVGNKNVVENSESSGELCSLIKEGETFKITDVLASANILSYLEVVKDEHFLYTTTFSIKASNIIDINSNFTAKRDTSITTHSLSISLKDSLKYKFINFQSSSLLVYFNSNASQIGLHTNISEQNSCLFSLHTLDIIQSSILTKESNGNRLLLLFLITAASLKGRVSNSYVSYSQSETTEIEYEIVAYELKKQHIAASREDNSTTMSVQTSTNKHVAYYVAGGMLLLVLGWVFKGSKVK